MTSSRRRGRRASWLASAAILVREARRMAQLEDLLRSIRIMSPEAHAEFKRRVWARIDAGS